MSTVNPVQDIDKVASGTSVTGDLMVKDYSLKSTKHGKPYITGFFSSNGHHGFKIWDSTLVAAFGGNDFSNKVLTVTGDVDEYNGYRSLIIQQATIKAEADIGEFLETPYTESFLVPLQEFVLGKMTDEGRQVVDLLLDDETMGKFATEFAAVSHHDNVYRGLLAHSLKVARLMTLVSNMYPVLWSRSDKDLLIVGAFLHDLGKVDEYALGTMNKDKLGLSHRYWGLERVQGFKDEIVALKGEDWYYRLIAIIMQHHGEWGERPQIIEAQVVHLVDNLEAQLTSISTAVGAAGGDQVQIFGLRLN